MRKLLVVLACVACGAEDHPAAGAQAAPITTESSPDTQAQRPDLYAMEVKQVGDLPYCTPESNGRIVYVTSEKRFKWCEGTLGTWYDVDLKGDKGADGVGKDGKDGANGKDGKDGAPGTAGVAGADGTDGAPGSTGATGPAGQTSSSSMWFDPVQKKWWTIPPSLATTYADAQAICTGDYRLPLPVEFGHSRHRGLPFITAAWGESGEMLSTTGDVLTGYAGSPRSLLHSEVR
jgi:hypothetical protein